MNRSEDARLTRIETLLEESLMRRLDDMAEDLKAIRADLDADKAELASLKSKGTGILIGIGLVGVGLGAGASSIAKWLAEIFS